MDAKRLEALVSLCDAYAADHDAGIADYLNTADIADLARCAAAWAALEKWVQSSSTLVEIIGYRGREYPWAVYPTRSNMDRYTGSTAIAAVEAAPEVGP
jgi:hypothetical protein